MEELSIRTTRRGKLDENPFLNVKNIKEGKNFNGCKYRFLNINSLATWSSQICFGFVKKGPYPLEDVFQMCVFKKYVIYDKKIIAQYINTLNTMGVFLKIKLKEEEETEEDYVIEIILKKETKREELLATATAVRYLYEPGYSADKRAIPYFFLYLNKFKELLPLERFFLAHCCKKFNFLAEGHSIYNTREFLPETNKARIKNALNNEKYISTAFKSGRVINFIKPYITRAELDELVQKFITYKKNGF